MHVSRLSAWRPSPVEIGTPAIQVGPYSVLDESPPGTARNHVKDGDILLGQIAVTCINCLRVRRYYVYFKMGTGGWVWPIPQTQKVVNILMPKVVSMPESQ